MNKEDKDAFNELSFYTLEHPDKVYFIHQHVVDAFHAQTADENTKPITIIFALVGVCLSLEKQFSGKQVQEAHMRLSKGKKKWPTFSLPMKRGVISVSDIINVGPSEKRDLKIKEWCSVVWNAFEGSQSTIRNLVSSELGIQKGT